jgi:hypothetical protein
MQVPALRRAKRGKEAKEKGERRLEARHTDLLTDRSSRRFLDFPMSRDGNGPAILWVTIDGMASAFSVEITPVLLQVPNEVPPLHDAGISTLSVSHTAFPGISFAAFSR